MLKGVPPIISPDLMDVLMSMGHGDELVLADANFPAAACAQQLVDASGHGAIELLEAILRFLPLDQYVEKPAAIMKVVPGDPTKPVIWKEFESVIKKYEPDFTEFDMVERFAFYERAKDAFAIVSTGETALYGNIILKKGVVRPSGD